MGSANGCNIGNLGDVALGIAPSGTQKVRKKKIQKKKKRILMASMSFPASIGFSSV